MGWFLLADIDKQDIQVNKNHLHRNEFNYTPKPLLLLFVDSHLNAIMSSETVYATIDYLQTGVDHCHLYSS